MYVTITLTLTLTGGYFERRGGRLRAFHLFFIVLSFSSHILLSPSMNLEFGDKVWIIFECKRPNLGTKLHLRPVALVSVEFL